MKPTYKIICGDALEVLPTLPPATMIFADPPDNLGVNYEGFVDDWTQKCQRYESWLTCRLQGITTLRVNTTKPGIIWFSINAKWLSEFLANLEIMDRCYSLEEWDKRLVIWRYTFGQHNQNDLGSGFRPIIRLKHPKAKLHPDAIRVPSARQKKYKDKRANHDGRVPDDVWEFPRVCGTFKERRKWHPNQHPEALMERIIKFSCKPGDTVIDLFGGTGTTLRVCKRLGISCTTIEISKFYCEKMAAETGVEAENK